MWHLLIKGEQNNIYSNHMEYLIDNKEDINTPPEDNHAPGSTAHTPGFTYTYVYNFNNQWIEIGGDG